MQIPATMIVPWTERNVAKEIAGSKVPDLFLAIPLFLISRDEFTINR